MPIGKMKGIGRMIKVIARGIRKRRLLKKVPADIRSAIVKACELTHAPIEYMIALAYVESGFDPKAKNPNSSATGLYQFIDATWKDMTDRYGQYANLPDRENPEHSAIMAGFLTMENRGYLLRHECPIDNTALYMAHFLGPAGARRFLRAMLVDPNVDASRAVSTAAVKYNHTIFNGPFRPRTLQEVHDLFTKKLTSVQI